MNQSEFNRRLLSTPIIANEIVDVLPAIIRECCSKFQDDIRRRDVLLTATLANLSSCMPSIWGRYDVLKLHANLFMLCVAPAASGKGSAVFAKKLVKALHDFIRGLDKDTIELETLQRKYGLYIPANSSAARFLQQLQENGGEGLIFETEIDTLVNAFAQDWGDFSSQLREAYQHEDISFSRKVEDAHVVIERPKVSVFMTGTPNQLMKLIPCSENGLFSRNCFYLFRRDLTRIDVTPKEEAEGFEEFFLAKGEEVKSMAIFLSTYPAEFKLRREHWEELNEFINENMFAASATHGSDSHSLTLRFGINLFRIAMVLSALRKWERRDQSDTLYCTSEDFKSAKALSKVYMEHTLLMLEALPKSNVGNHINYLARLLMALPSSFTRADAIAVGEQLGFSSSTVDRNLKKWADAGQLEHTHGRYQKPE